MTETPEPKVGFTILHNPSTGDPWNCPDAAVEDWESRGWTKTAPGKSSLSAMTKAELLDEAAKRGVLVDAGDTKAQIIDALDTQEG